jgi:AhpD family alkylhydroperoxidase
LRERELIAVVVSAQNGCGLCEVHHTNALGDALDDPTRARRIALDYHLAPLTERERALADFAVKVTTNPKDIGTGDLERLRAVGLSDPDIVEALETSAWFNHTNRIFIFTRRYPGREVFRELKASRGQAIGRLTLLETILPGARAGSGERSPRLPVRVGAVREPSHAGTAPPNIITSKVRTNDL